MEKYVLTFKMSTEMKILSPTAEDTIKNRLRVYLLHGATKFNHTAAAYILISLDKDNAKTSKSAKYLGKVVEGSVSGAAYLGGAGHMSKAIGSFSSEIVSEIASTVDKNKQHKVSKKIEKFLEGFDPEDEDWIRFLLTCLSDIFIR